MLTCSQLPLLPSHRTSTTATQIIGAERGQEERILVVPSASSSRVVLSFACPNLHHTTHQSSSPQSSPELCMELGNKPKPP